jgi:thioredoxin-like negative regulator of GroEL
MSDLKTLHDFVDREDFKNAYTLGTILLNKNPEDPQTLYLMGYTLRATNQLGVALPVLSKAIARYPKDRPQQPNLWMTYAATLHDLNRWEDAEKAFTSVLTMLPDDPKVMANIAATYVQRGAWRDAKNWADRALAINPDEHIAQISKGFACLSLGRWKEAWKYHEALYGNHVHTRVYCNPPEPEWDGTKGQTVVVQTDQGVGDIIMFSQCLPELQADCKEVIVECASRLVNYFRRNFPGVIVYGTGKDQTASWPLDHKIDASIHISALGKFYRNLDKDFPESSRRRLICAAWTSRNCGRSWRSRGRLWTCPTRTARTKSPCGTSITSRKSFALRLMRGTTKTRLHYSPLWTRWCRSRRR